MHFLNDSVVTDVYILSMKAKNSKSSVIKTERDVLSVILGVLIVP